jgi:hypothetical protein
MKQKHELSIVSPNNESNKESKRKQIMNTLFGDKILADVKMLIISNLTDSELDKTHTNVAMTSKAHFNLFKPNFRAELVNKLLTCVAMGEQYAFCTEVMTQEPSEIDKKEVTDKRKILFISMYDNVQMCYCSDNWVYVRTDVKNEALKNILTKYKEGQPIQNVGNLSKINQILTWSGIRTQQDKAERLLKTSPELMIIRTTFTDASGRTFSNISAFEYVLWALDTRYMVNMMLNCLPHNEVGLMIAKTLKKQYEHVAKEGVTYTLKGKTITEKHFDCSVLINALQTYAGNYDQWNGPQCQHYWCTDVGMEQRYLPAHMIQHYCDPNTPFFPTPSFTAEQFVRTLKFFNWDNGQEMTWSGSPASEDSVLDVNFGIIRASRGGAWMLAWVGCGTDPDLVALTALSKVRTEDFTLLGSRLENLCQNLIELKNSNTTRSRYLFPHHAM